MRGSKRGCRRRAGGRASRGRGAGTRQATEPARRDGTRGPDSSGNPAGIATENEGASGYPKPLFLFLNPLPTRRGFDILHQSVLPRSQPPVEEGICGQVDVPNTSSTETHPDALHPDTPAVFFVRRRECGSAQSIY